MRALIVVAAVAAMSWSSVATLSAQLEPTNNNPVTKLDNIIGLTCTFPVGSRVTWAKDGTVSAAIRQGTILTVKVAKIDTQDGLGEFTAPATAEALVQLYGWNMHVMEPSRSGRMLMLTVFGRESVGGKLKATYTRTDYLPVDLPGFISEPESAQYYGDCEVQRR